jgi:CubicO group peptidase (beta-lactamase class C family)
MLCKEMGMPDLARAFEHLARYLEQQMAEHTIPGLSLALTDRQQTLSVTGYGYAEIGTRTPVTADTLFPIGSITKSFTAVAVLQQREAGRLDLHEPVRSYLPWFGVDSAYEPITSHHLLSNTSGLPRNTLNAPAPLPEVRALGDARVGFPPGTRFHYSNVGFATVGLVLEAVSQQAYGDLIRAQILGPLEMDDTRPAITNELRRSMAIGYAPYYDDRPTPRGYPPVPGRWIESAAASGCIASTAGDMAKYLRMLLNRGGGPGARVIPEEGFGLMIEPVAHVWESIHYGYGTYIDRAINGNTWIGHGGAWTGFSANMTCDLDAGLGAVVLTNWDGVDPFPIGVWAIELLDAALRDRPLPDIPPARDPTRVDNTDEYAGRYVGVDSALSIAAQDDHLLLEYGGDRIVLEERGYDAFYAEPPGFSLYHLRFHREDGRVVAVSHGSDWFPRERYSGRTAEEHPSEWAAFAGHYRSHDPWFPSLRVLLRRGELVLIFDPAGTEEWPLVPSGDGAFRVGQEGDSPEWISFGTMLEGQALRATWSGREYHRAFI